MTTAWVPVGDLLEGVLAGRLTDGPPALAVLPTPTRTATAPALTDAREARPRPGRRARRIHSARSPRRTW